MEKFIMANDTALRISDSGRGETTLALLHGYLESLEVWEDLAKRLAPYYRIVAIDIPWRDTRWAAMPQRLLPNVIPTCFRD